ncbi:adenosylcobinamide-phosphate synthase CbiB [Cohaesibacter celericrescens]|uniref:adenosylcobinamide-phosphate synthase CbiB n=1 Tax=Cohaesibacter celericrescens TaxID=2067669 RepID=UPI00356428F6
MILLGGGFLFVVALAIALDAIFGEPDWVWRRVPHPVVWFGAWIERFETRFNQPKTQSAQSGRLSGLLSLVFLVAAGGALSWVVQSLLLSFGFLGGVVLALLSSTLLAQKSLYLHVKAVEDPLACDDILAARKAVSMIVGRDPEKLDGAGVARASIESLAENFSDGIVAPIFWLALLGLPGLVIYKIINTADSMIGHKTERYLHFGWAAARLDDGVNLVPARLTMGLLLLSPFRSRVAEQEKTIARIWRGIAKDAPRHRSPNAGWPEAAMAGRLDIALSGPRYYGTEMVDEPFVNARGRRDVGAAEVDDALRLYRSSCLVQFMIIIAIALVSY